METVVAVAATVVTGAALVISLPDVRRSLGIRKM
jgi:hypothetical protein